MTLKQCPMTPAGESRWEEFQKEAVIYRKNMRNRILFGILLLIGILSPLFF